MDTYDSALGIRRTGTELISDMDIVVAELDFLIANPLADTATLVDAIEAVRDDGRLSLGIMENSGPTKTWGYQYGRQMVMDVVESAQRLLQDVRLVPQVPTAAIWQAIKTSSIHPGWWSFYNTPHTD